MVENSRSDGEKADHRLPSITSKLKGGSDEQDPGFTQAAVLNRLGENARFIFNPAILFKHALRLQLSSSRL